MFAFATVVTAGVVGLWLYAMQRNPSQTEAVHVTTLSQRFLIFGGMLPAVSIVLLLIAGVPIGQRMQPQFLDTDEETFIEVTGHQWWWEINYPGTDVTLENTLHIPTGTPINVHLRSSDVIHSFWVPRLTGKLDAIPGRTNILRLQADEPGTYFGQCAEFCGLQHTHMRFTVVAHTPENFATWLAELSSDD